MHILMDFYSDGTYNNSINDEKNCEFKSLEGKAYCKDI